MIAAEAINKLLLTLESDLHQGGWDQPSGIWVMEAVTPDDPYLVKVCEFTDHPCAVLDTAPELDDPRARGIVLANEAWMVEASGQLQQAIEDVTPHEMPEMLRKELIKRLMEVAARSISPSQHPDRIEARLIHCIMKTGDVHAISRRRDQEPEVIDAQLDGRVYDSMRRVICAREQA